nr:MAG TPA: hypothetical protein [Caudoviricetes sp.]
MYEPVILLHKHIQSLPALYGPFYKRSLLCSGLQ